MESSKFDKTMTAVAFAEAGEHETAREVLGGGGKRAVRQPDGPKAKPYLKTLVFGAISVSAYVLLFKNESLVTTNFTLGGWHTLLPVGTAFFFSFVHGAFASNLLSTLGLEAKK